MQKTLRILAAAFLLTPWLAVSSAQAALFNFSYTTETGQVISGMLDGVVQAGGDDVVVTDIMGLQLDGVSPGFDIGFVESAVEFVDGPPPLLDPVVSFSGLNMDIIACENSICDEGFAVFFIDGIGMIFNGTFVFNQVQTFDRTRWTLTAEAVSEPAGLLLLGVGLLGLVATARRRA